MYKTIGELERAKKKLKRAKKIMKFFGLHKSQWGFGIYVIVVDHYISKF